MYSNTIHRCCLPKFGSAKIRRTKSSRICNNFPRQVAVRPARSLTYALLSVDNLLWLTLRGLLAVPKCRQHQGERFSSSKLRHPRPSCRCPPSLPTSRRSLRYLASPVTRKRQPRFCADASDRLPALCAGINSLEDDPS